MDAKTNRPAQIALNQPICAAYKADHARGLTDPKSHYSEASD